MNKNNNISEASEHLKKNLTAITLLESIAEGVVIVNDSGNIVLVNNSMSQLFGYEREEITGKHLDILLPENFRKKHYKLMLDYFKKPYNRPMGKGLELIGLRKDGVEIPIEISLSSITVDSHKLALAFISDITQRKLAQDQLLQQNEDLDAFAHTVAHDLNSTINSIIGFSQLLVEDNSYSKEERSEILSLIFRSSNKMSNIIHELLVFANIRKTEVLLTPIDTLKIIDEVIIRLGFQLTEKKAEITIPKTFETALGYTSWVEEVWYNLISNAIKYGGTPPKIELGSDAH